MDISEFVGETFSKIENIDNEEIFFHTYKGESFRMYHENDCCEKVFLQDICGDLDDLIDSEILSAEEVTNSNDDNIPHPSTGYDEWDKDSFTWTFYKFQTQKGFITLRWLGLSNGCYSEKVSLEKIKTPEEEKNCKEHKCSIWEMGVIDKSSSLTVEKITPLYRPTFIFPKKINL